MEFTSKMIILTGLVFFFLIVLAQDAHAYLDPGTGSYFFQILIAGLLGVLFFMKNFWRNLATALKSFFFKAIGFVKKLMKNV